MKTGQRIGVGRTLLIAVLALLFGALGGGVVARGTTTTKVIETAAPSGTASPASTTSSDVGAPMSWSQVAKQAGPAVVTIVNQQQPQQDLFGNQVPGATAEG